MSATIPSEGSCRDCRWFTLWCGGYGGPAGYPACTHPTLPAMRLIPDELDRCPEDG